MSKINAHAFVEVSSKTG